MKYKSLVVALVAGLAAGTALATPAQAVPVPPGLAVTPWLPCSSGATTGSITSVSLDSWVSGTAQLTVVGQITPCQSAGPGTVFAVAKYHPAIDSAPASATAQFLAYSATTATGSYRTTITVTPQDVALCVVSGPYTRLDCSALDWPTDTELVVTGHLPIDDSRVLVRLADIDPGEHHPGCPVCWY